MKTSVTSLNTAMTLEDFQDFIERHGENPVTWPEAERGRANALLERSTKARDLLNELRDLRAFASEDAAIKAPARLKQAVLDKTVGATRKRVPEKN